MAFLAKKSSIKMLRKGDPKWFISDDNIKITPRAGFEINRRCPEEYKFIINECIASGWLNPVAYVKENEFMWEILNED